MLVKEKQPETQIQPQAKSRRKPKPNHIKTRKFRLISQNSPELDELFARIYPARYMELLNQLDDWFAQQAPEFFGSTNIQWIKKLVVNNNPDLKPEKLRHHTRQDFLFNTRTIWCAEIMVYFAYRNKVIRDRSLQLIASYLNNRTLVSQQELIHLFQAEDIPVAILSRFYERLKADLRVVFSKWKGVRPTRYGYKNMFRQVRNLVCQALPDINILTATKTFLEQKNQKQIARELLAHFQDNPAHKPLSEYLVDVLWHKVNYRIKPTFRAIWHKYFYWPLQKQTQKRKNPRLKAYRHLNIRLKGLRKIIYDFLNAWLKAHPEDENLTTHELWQRLYISQTNTGIKKKTKTNQLREHIRQAYPVWQQLMTQLDETQLATDSVSHVVPKIAIQISTEKANPNQPEVKIPDKKYLFRAIHRATPLHSFELPTSGQPSAEMLIPSLLEFLKTRFARQAETIMRTALVEKLFPAIETILNDPPVFINARPAFKNPGFALNIADKQMFRLDVDKKEFQLKFTTKLPVGITDISSQTWFRFQIYDQPTRQEQQRGKQPRFNKLLSEGWKPLVPKLVYRDKHLFIHIPFGKYPPENTDTETNPASTGISRIQANNSKVKEIIIGSDQGLGKYAVISVMASTSLYQNVPKPTLTPKLLKTTSNKGKKNSRAKFKKILQREVLSQEELANYSLDDTEVLDIKFNPSEGVFNNGKRVNGQFQKRKGRSTRGKGKLQQLRYQLNIIQSRLNEFMAKFPQSYPGNPTYMNLKKRQSWLWAKFQRILETIGQSLAAKLKDIAVYFDTIFKLQNPQYQDYTVRVQVEDLRWAQNSPRYVVGAYLAQNQILFFYSQVQQRLGHLLKEHHLGLWRVNPYHSSQTCARCSHYTANQRKGKIFRCRNPYHRTAKGAQYTCNADLNAGRNVALWTPNSVKAINT